MNKENSNTEIKAYSFKIIQKYILYATPFLFLAIYIASILSASLLFVVTFFMMGFIYWKVIELVKEKEINIILEENKVIMNNKNIFFSNIENYYLSKVTNKLLGLRVKTKENKMYIYFTDLENKKLLMEYFNSNNIIEKRRAVDIYIRLFSVVLICIVMFFLTIVLLII
ncbi:hypothetical protein [uncultured Apibacter sp.]|uniref:hypothetical protein n=1 Tax=uncultured Apibacter sp. TaxID=1778616 RepID=UPI0025F8B2A8|nr:hypothetical protein [uncultured Apibacter sp.]